MSTIACLFCTGATTGAALCIRCQKTVRHGLENVGAYHADLLSLGSAKVQIARRPTGVSDPSGSAAVRTPTAEPDAPDTAAAETKTQLVGWVLALTDDRPGMFKEPADTVAALVTFLDRQVRTIATLEWAGEFVRQVLSLERRLRRIVARGKGQWYAGVCSAVIQPERVHDGLTCACSCHNGLDYPCDLPGGCGAAFVALAAELCEQDIYAVPGSSHVRCTACRTQHRVSERRAVLLAEARETELPLKDIAHLCVALLDDEPSVQRFAERLNTWVRRGDLVWCDHDGGVRLYRVGDVIDLLTRHAADPRGWGKRVTAC